ncbi:MAG: response regulator transcription factor [Candidatus Promineofilum sp.]|jgi:DNA-binding response OmpR family regulator|nr:response regulator transcription factor [Promineifilum sp.]
MSSPPTPEPDTILIVDDEPSVVEVVALYLQREGFHVRTARDGAEALLALSGERPALVILDVMLPHIDGLSILRRLRQNPAGNVPVILLTARGQEVDRIAGLDLGADDYVTKPFSPAELVSRVRAVLRRAAAPALGQSDAPIIHGELRLDPGAREVTLRGRPVELTATEFNLLWFLAAHPRQVFRRDKLLAEVWGYADYLDPSTVTVHIRRLREKIERDPAKPAWLQTVWGVGYKFDPEGE